jgi:hypothetical protein
VGYTARANDHTLSQHLGFSTTICLATAIEAGKETYYLKLDKASKGSLDINEWLYYFSQTMTVAQSIAKEKGEFSL